MKIKTPTQIYDTSNKIPEDFIRQVQAVADDVRTILKGGLSFIDRQLPFQYQEAFITSGQPFILNIQNPYQIIGCIPIQTNGNVIESFSTNTLNGVFSITLNLSNSTTGRIGFLTVGTN